MQEVSLSFDPIVSHNLRRRTINWVNDHVVTLPDEPPLPDEVPEVAELDELFTFVGEKKTEPTSSLT